MASKGKKTNIYESLLSREDWTKIIAKKIKTNDFDIIKTSIGPLSEEQLGFMGDHLKLTATVKLHEEKKELNLNFFSKALPQTNATFREYVDTIGAFVKETGFFADLLPDLNKYIIKKNADIEDDGNTWTCKCYFSRPDIIVLEDLTAIGFKQVEDRQALDYDHCIAVLKVLADYHASSIILEEKQTKAMNAKKTYTIFDKYSNILFETEWVTTEGHPGNKFLNSSVKGMETIVKYLPNYGKNYENFKLIQEKVTDVSKMMCDVVKPSKKYRNVLCQGDLTVNNIFFKYKDDGKTPVEARIIDFQVMRYNPPSSEVLWFLHLVTRKDFRDKHVD
ncbi:hypothetical protein L9F63_017354 [Diploptera punctata]|uniref:CHK kinase-like domain-containing protein n=1 Tax=Diploptera punctata TaxID=6984 RepID=A0AAD8EGN8_DIPPU|nr:hypothetical protein L9F63_017354 [Diploptera punctata]